MYTKLVCVSLYPRDIKALEAKIATLKRRGYPRTQANKSALIRYALQQVDIDKIPR